MGFWAQILGWKKNWDNFYYEHADSDIAHLERIPTEISWKTLYFIKATLWPNLFIDFSVWDYVGIEILAILINITIGKIDLLKVQILP